MMAMMKTKVMRAEVIGNGADEKLNTAGVKAFRVEENGGCLREMGAIMHTGAAVASMR